MSSQGLLGLPFGVLSIDGKVLWTSLQQEVAGLEPVANDADVNLEAQPRPGGGRLLPQPPLGADEAVFHADLVGVEPGVARGSVAPVRVHHPGESGVPDRLRRRAMPVRLARARNPRQLGQRLRGRRSQIDPEQAMRLPDGVQAEAQGSRGLRLRPLARREGAGARGIVAEAVVRALELPLENPSQPEVRTLMGVLDHRSNTEGGTPHAQPEVSLLGAPGGAQARCGVTPDLTMLGKAVGDGRADLMRLYEPQAESGRGLYPSGTWRELRDRHGRR